jgi:hypothetical protein
MTPGGDFGWLKKDYVWNPGWAPQSEDGDTHGHNIIAADFNYLADASNTSTPGGGSIDPTDLACSSCHDQHSKLRRTDSTGTIVTTGAPIVDSGSYGRQPITGEAVGVYRLLRGTGSDAGTGGVNYTVPPMAAITPGSYNRSEAVTDTRVAYGAGVSDWCATCHPDMHTDSGNLVHPVDQNLFSTIAGNYNSYVGSGDTSGSIGTAYDSLIPFAFDNSTDYAALALQANSDGSFTDGPASTDRVMCLTCHRAHASGWEYSGRWDLEKELIIVDGEWPGTDATSTEAALPTWAKGRSVLERTTAYNDKPATRYATYQRSLCNKCHLKD